MVNEMGSDNKKPPSIEIKTGYVHAGVVEDMLKKRESAGVLPIAMLTTNRFSKQAKKMLDERDIAYAEIPETEILQPENKESE